MKKQSTAAAPARFCNDSDLTPTSESPSDGQKTFTDKKKPEQTKSAVARLRVSANCPRLLTTLFRYEESFGHYISPFLTFYINLLLTTGARSDANRITEVIDIGKCILANMFL